MKEIGAWIIGKAFVYGVRVKEEKLKELVKERKINQKIKYHEGQGPTLFNIHEYSYATLNGWCIGNEENPEGLVIGSFVNIDCDNFNIEELNDNLEQKIIDFDKFDLLSIMEEHIGEQNFEELKLHLVVFRYWKSKEEIEEQEDIFPGYYPQYLDIIKNNRWEIREI